MVGRLDSVTESGRTRRRWRQILGVALVAGVSVTSCTQPASTGELGERLADALGTDRVIRARLSGAFLHGPCKDRDRHNTSVVGGILCSRPSPTDPIPNRDVRALAGAILDHSSSSRDAQSLHLVGQWTLLTATEEDDFRRALRELELAAGQAESPAAILSDISAARMALAEATDDPHSIVEAISAADSAVALDSTVAEAWFNRALARDRLGLRRGAIEAWERYLVAESNGPWAEEAGILLDARLAPRANWIRDRERLIGAQENAGPPSLRAMVQQYPTQLADYVVESLLTGWAQATIEGRTVDADTAWVRITRIAEALDAVEGMSFVEEALSALDGASGPDRRNQIEALLSMGEGIANEADPERASNDLTAAADVLERRESPLAYYPLSRLASIAWLGYENDEVDRLAQRMLSVAPGRAPNHRAAYAWMWRSRVADDEVRHSDARAATERSLALSYPTQRELRARAFSDLARYALSLGGPTEAWVPMFMALRTLEMVDEPRALNTVLRRLTDLLELTGHSDLALEVWQGVIDVAEETENINLLVSGLIRRARQLAHAERHDGARNAAARALRLTGQHLSEESQATRRREVMLLLGEVSADVAPAQAVDTLEAVIGELRALGSANDLVRAYLALAMASMGSGDFEAGEEALTTAIEITEQQRESLRRDDRMGFQDRARPIFEQLVGYYAANDRVAEAFDFFEQMRARVLLEDAGRGGSRSPITLADLRATLPEELAVVSYAVFEEELYAWLVSSDQVRLGARRVSAASIRRLVTTFRQAIQGSDGERIRTIGRELCDLLFGLWGTAPDLPERVVLIPDRSLHYLPFVALSNENGFLLEQHEISVAPSASLYALATRRSRNLRAAGDATVFVVANPDFPKDRFRRPDLPHAIAEARSVEAAWQERAEVVTGAQATRTALLAGASNASIVHFAGHAVVRPDSPLDSYLLLAPEAGWETSLLTAGDLVGLSLPATRLVVLSACSTADGRLSETEGVSSLARGFLGAGVPEMVSSLWPVMDEEAARFFESFHGHLRDGATAPAALRAAQREMASDGATETGAIATWAAFQFLGGG
jgi:CHAT domain-containing protein